MAYVLVTWGMGPSLALVVRCSSLEDSEGADCRGKSKRTEAPECESRRRGREGGVCWGGVRTEGIWAHWALVCTSMQQPHIPLQPHSRITRQADSPWLLGKKRTLGLLQGLHFQPYKDKKGRGEGDRQGHGDGDIIQGHGEGDRQRRKEVYPALIPSGWEALQGNSAGQSNSST